MNQPIDIQNSLQAAQLKLVAAGLKDSPRLDAELLLGHALQVNRTYLFTWSDKQLTPEQSTQFEHFLDLRLEGHPIAHIICEREFWGLVLKVTKDTLIPRPDTETLIEAVLELNQQALQTQKTSNNFAPSRGTRAGGGSLEILDLGTGTGAIALALKSELANASLTAVDFSQKALEVAQQNATRHQLDINFIQSDWLANIESEKTFDYIVSNPPYIESSDPHLAEGDVRFEPITALTAGEDGLEDIRTITLQAHPHLKIAGWLLIEHGYNQAESVAEIFAQNGYANISLLKDLGGNPRITQGQKA